MTKQDEIIKFLLENVEGYIWARFDGYYHTVISGKNVDVYSNGNVYGDGTYVGNEPALYKRIGAYRGFITTKKD
jgi:hypothetical protein